MALTAVFLLLSYAVFIQSTHVIGRFGDHVIPSEIVFGKDEMVVTIQRPDNAPEIFRETTNLHIFSTHTVAARNFREKHCYIRHFLESKDRMMGRVENAEYNHGEMSLVMEERVTIDGLDPLNPRTIPLLLGPRVADFCKGHDVYLVSAKEISLLDPKGRSKRTAVVQFNVAGFCDGCELYQLEQLQVPQLYGQVNGGLKQA